MESFWIALSIVALAEIGDKTQLLSFILAARYRKPIPIIAGIFVATILNHALAGAVGVWITTLLGPNIMVWVLGISFIAMAIWMLIPDKIDEDDVKLAQGRWGVFGITTIAFFIAEMGDKTQVATVALGAQYPSYVGVVAGTTLGMMLANIPAVILGDRIANKLPTRLIHSIAALIFLVLGVLAIAGGTEFLENIKK